MNRRYEDDDSMDWDSNIDDVFAAAPSVDWEWREDSGLDKLFGGET